MKEWHDVSAEEMLEHSRLDKKVTVTKPGDLGVRVGLLLLMPYVFWLSKYTDSYVSRIHGKTVHFNLDGMLLSFHNLINGGNMIVHEAGHGVCYLLPCPEFLMFMNGTLFQLALPLIFIYYYYKKGQKVLSGLGGMWLAQNLVYVAWYMSYAQTPNRYPFFLGGSATHDFWYMFSQMGVLEYDWLFSGVVRTVAIVILWGSYAYLLYISFIKNETRRAKRFRKEYNE